MQDGFHQPDTLTSKLWRYTTKSVDTNKLTKHFSSCDIVSKKYIIVGEVRYFKDFEVFVLICLCLSKSYTR